MMQIQHKVKTFAIELGEGFKFDAKDYSFVEIYLLI
jgi:hypothetical protein